MKQCYLHARIFILGLVVLSIVGCSGEFEPVSTATGSDTRVAVGTATQPSAASPTTQAFGGTIAYVSSRGGKYDIYVMSADGGYQKDLTGSLAGSLDPAWSPDGKRLAFTSYSEQVPQIFSMSADGSDQRQLTFGEAASDGPAWSPDGRYIVFLSERDGVLSISKGVPTPEVCIMQSDGLNQRRLTNNHDFERELAWSPSGNAILLSANRLTDSGIYAREQIYVVSLDGVIQKQLTDSAYDDEHPAWSPIGDLIAFASNRDGESGIYVMKTDGSNQVRLTSSANTSSSALYVNNLSPSWSPDGKYIVFFSNRSGNYDLYIMRANGLDLVRLTHLPGDEMSPAWSPTP